MREWLDKSGMSLALVLAGLSLIACWAIGFWLNDGASASVYDFATWIQTGALIATAWIVAWYAWETRRMGQATVRSAEAAERHLDADRQAELSMQLLPVLEPSGGADLADLVKVAQSEGVRAAVSQSELWLQLATRLGQHVHAGLVNLGRGGAANVTASMWVVRKGEPRAADSRALGSLVGGSQLRVFLLSGSTDDAWVIQATWYEPAANDWQCRCYFVTHTNGEWDVRPAVVPGVQQEFVGKVPGVCQTCRDAWDNPARIAAVHCPAIESRQRRMQQMGR